MKRHTIKCDSCLKFADLMFNGEHYLPPEGWVVLHDENLVEDLNLHLCNVCVSKLDRTDKPKEEKDDCSRNKDYYGSFKDDSDNKDYKFPKSRADIIGDRPAPTLTQNKEGALE